MTAGEVSRGNDLSFWGSSHVPHLEGDKRSARVLSFESANRATLAWEAPATLDGREQGLLRGGIAPFALSWPRRTR